jgi:hypothetical protein
MKACMKLGAASEVRILGPVFRSRPDVPAAPELSGDSLARRVSIGERRFLERLPDVELVLAMAELRPATVVALCPPRD